MLFILQPPRWERHSADFRTLHLSLNAPVIAIDEMPVGPARAGIALCAERSGTLRLQIAVRSLQTGQVITFAPSDELTDEHGAALALAAGFSFAEGMGFLFDDEDTTAWAGDDPAAATAAWRELVGEAPLRGTARVHWSADAAAEPPTIDLIEEIAVHASPAASAGVCIEFQSEAAGLAPEDNGSASVLSKHRLVLGGRRPVAPAPAAPQAAMATLVPASVHPHDTRIRLLSRF